MTVDLSSFLVYSAILVGFSVFLPMIYVLLAVRLGKITDVHVAIKEQRELPFKIAILGSFVILLIYNIMDANTELIAMALALLVNGIVFTLLTKYWKVSMHAATWVSSVTLASILVSSNIFWLYIFLIPIFWARIHRGKHSFWQLIIAAVVSGAITSTILLIFNKYF